MMIRLLIADDERLEREALAEMVTRRFVEHEIVLEEAENGRKAADTAILWGADLILMDIEMPGMNGLDAARAVLAQRPGCRVIFVTAYSLFQYAHEAVHLGACDYLLKPVDPDELEASIRRAIRQIETERKLEALAPIQQEQEPETPPRRTRKAGTRAARTPLSWRMCGGISKTTICSTSRWTAWARSCTSARPTSRPSSRNTRR